MNITLKTVSIIRIRSRLFFAIDHREVNRLLIAQLLVYSNLGLKTST